MVKACAWGAFFDPLGSGLSESLLGVLQTQQFLVTGLHFRVGKRFQLHDFSYCFIQVPRSNGS